MSVALAMVRAHSSRMHNTAAAEQIVTNARRKGIDAFHTSVALDLVAPVVGRTWTAICCWCLDRTAHTTPDELVHRVALERWQNGGPCMLCPYSGCDTLVVALEVVS